jgi:predicted acylesterase/phospholipase RssA
MLKSFVILLITICVFGQCLTQEQDKCRVLALEGGGDHGAYQAGVLKGLISNLKSSETRWDVVTGISVGSLNAAALAIYEIGDETAAVDFILETWRNIKGKGDIYQNWWLGPLYGLFYKTGVYDTTPLKKMLTSILKSKSLKRKITIGATEMKTGGYVVWDEESFSSIDDFVSAILSSSAFPVLFPNIDFNSKQYMDGGVKISVDLFSGIKKCLDMGFEQENIIVDVVLCQGKSIDNILPDNMKTLDVLMRTLEIFSYDGSMRDIDQIMHEAYPKVTYRYVVKPTAKLPSGSLPLVFKPNQIEEMINLGIKDAVSAVASGKTIKDVIEEYNKERLQSVMNRPLPKIDESQLKKEIEQLEFLLKNE